MAICLVQVIRTPPLLKRRFDRAVRRCGLHNAQNEYPVLISVKRDKDKPHGLILKVRNKGLSLPDFDRHYEWLKVTMGGIFRMEYGRNITIPFYIFSHRNMFRPALFTPDDSASGSIDVKHIINMLIVGATGTGKTVALKSCLQKLHDSSRTRISGCLILSNLTSQSFGQTQILRLHRTVSKAWKITMRRSSSSRKAAQRVRPNILSLMSGAAFFYPWIRKPPSRQRRGSRSCSC